MRPSTRRRTAWIATFVMLFAQLAVAAYACPLPAASVPAVAASPCDEVDGQFGNLCQKHCHDAEQSQDGVAPMVGFIPSFVVQVQVSAASHAAARRVEASPLLHAPPPSLAIRNCCFRI